MTTRTFCDFCGAPIGPTDHRGTAGYFTDFEVYDGEGLHKKAIASFSVNTTMKPETLALCAKDRLRLLIKATWTEGAKLGILDVEPIDPPDPA